MVGARGYLWGSFPIFQRKHLSRLQTFFYFALKCAKDKGFSTVSFGVFPGKLIKMAQGYKYTHAKHTKIDFNLLSKWAEDVGFSKDVCYEIKGANTGRHVMEIIDRDKQKKIAFIESLCKRAILVGKRFSDNSLNIAYYVFDYSEDFIFSYAG